MSNGLKPSFTPEIAAESTQFRAEGVEATENAGLWGGIGLRIKSVVDELPAWWSPARDRFLRQTIHDGTFISAVCYGESTRVKNSQFTLVDETKDNPELIKKFQLMLSTCNFGTGFPEMASSVALDLLTQDNGAFIELIGEGSHETELKGEVTSFAYLDSAQCWRTFDPEFPVVYTNPYTGEFRILHNSRIIVLSQFRQGQELARGLGLCALSRAYESFRIMRSMNTYLFEKITGQSPEIHFANIPAAQFKRSLDESQLSMDNKGFRVFKDHSWILPRSIAPGMPDLRVQTVGLKNTPDGFDHESETEMAVYAISAAFGVDAREYWVAVQTGATKGDAEVQQLKSEAKGIFDIINMIENVFNWRVFPEGVSLRYSKTNVTSDKLKAEVTMARAQARAVQIASGEITREEARQMASETGDIPSSIDANVPVEEESIPDQEPAAEQPSAVPDKDQIKSKSLSAFRSAIRSNVRGLWNGSFSRSQFIFDMNLAIERRLTEAWNVGAKELGVNPADVSVNDRRVLSNTINEQIFFVPAFADAIEDGSQDNGGDLAVLFSRSEMWANQYRVVKAFAKQTLGDLERLEWVLGPTEHCVDCLSLAGKVFTARQWKEADVRPGSHDLACTGLNCQCRFKNARTKALTPGKVPELKGAGRSRLRRLFR